MDSLTFDCGGYIEEILPNGETIYGGGMIDTSLYPSYLGDDDVVEVYGPWPHPGYGETLYGGEENLLEDDYSI